MLGLAPLRRTGWNYVSTGLVLAIGGTAIGVPLAHRWYVAAGLAVAGLVVVAIGVFAYRRRDPILLRPRVAEAVEILNLDPMDLILPGEPRSLDMALSALEMRVNLWRGDVMRDLEASHAHWSEVSSFDLLGTYEPVAPGRNERHMTIKGMLAGRLERLREIIKTMETES